jgi:CheY-like chemotaxis protein
MTDLCPICGQHFADGEPRYRRPDGDVHVPCFKGPRVLVVDDDMLLRDLVAHLVRRNRFCQVQTVSNGQEALERIRTDVYDLILCDLRMPTMDGPAFYREVRAAHPDLVERIVFMTAHLKVDEYAQFIQDVGAPLLNKPFPREDLDEILGRMIGPTRPGRKAREET